MLGGFGGPFGDLFGGDLLGGDLFGGDLFGDLFGRRRLGFGHDID